ncbi:hypothetical protein OQB33_004154, partial [Salmonella enterica]|nr:hypothetical protein [Salmonella enterica]
AVSGSWTAQAGSKIETRNRVQINDVKKLKQGESFLIFQDSLVEMSAFYIPDDDKHTKLKPRINQFIEIDLPTSISEFNTEPVVIPVSESDVFINKIINGIPHDNSYAAANDYLADAELEIDEELRNQYSDDEDIESIKPDLTLTGQKKRLLRAALNGLENAA